MRRSPRERGKVSIGCLIWLAIVGLVGYAIYIIVPVKVSTSTFFDYMQEQASFGSVKSVPQIERELIARAKELKLPIDKDDIVITKTRESIKIEAHYEITLIFFNGVYKYLWKFDPVVARPLFLV